MKIYLVGGAVRDQLLDIPSKDKDWVVIGSSSKEMLELGYQQVGADFPVFIHPDSHEEYALARTERKKGYGYQGFTCHTSPDVTLEEDLLRRDLTINAMAMDNNGNTIDPYGGRTDIKNKILRHVSAAFSEDPLRILRVARFAARFSQLGFNIAPKTIELMSDMVLRGEADYLVPERVWQETQRALKEKSPWTYFETLQQTNCLEVLFKELNVLFGIPQPKQHHPEIDCGIHALLSLKAACILSIKPEVRFASLVHDLGKACTDSSKWPRHHGHETLGLAPITQLCARLKIPNNYKELAALVSEFHTHIHKAFELTEKTILKVFKRCDAFRRPGRFHDLLLCCEADSKGRYGFEENAYPQADFFKEALSSANAVTVEDLISQGFKGKQLGIQIDLHRCNNIKAFALSYPS